MYALIFFISLLISSYFIGRYQGQRNFYNEYILLGKVYCENQAKNEKICWKAEIVIKDKNKSIEGRK